MKFFTLFFTAFFCPIISFAALGIDETKSNLKVRLSVSSSDHQKILKGNQPAGLVPVGKPGDPAAYARVLHVAIPAGSEVTLKTVRKKISEIGAQTQFFRDSNHSFKKNLSPRLDSVTISEKRKFRQVEYVDVYIYPVLFHPRLNTASLLSSVEFDLEFSRQGSAVIQEQQTYAELYDRFFLNSWRDKGSSEKLPSAASLESITAWQPPAHTGDVYKIKVRKDGIYRIDSSHLSGTTLAAADPQRFRLFNRGNEIPLHVTGESDGIFHPTDAIYFYGQALTGENETGVWMSGDFTDENVYWLMADASANGARMPTRDVTPDNSYTTAASFTSTVHFEQNLEIVAYQNDPDTDLWLWQNSFRLSGGAASIKHHLVTVPGISNDGSYVGSLRFTARGRSFSTTVNPDHHTILKINGTEVGNFTSDGYESSDQTFPFSQSLFGGSGNISVDVSHEVADPALIGVGSDAVQSNWFDLTYSRIFQAYNEELGFEYGAGNHRFVIPGFSSNDLIALDIEDPAHPVLLTGGAVDFSGNHQLTFEDATVAPTSYYAAVAAEPAAADFVPDTASSLTLIPTNTKWIMIVPDGWTSLTSVQNLKNLRQSEGLNPQIVSVTDIYDEFSYGIFAPQAIRDFLQSVYEAGLPSPELQYVVLLGDAEYDYKDYLPDGNSNQVPTWMVADPGFGGAFHPLPMHSFDNYFVTFDGDSIPEVFLGRIPARTTSVADVALNKIIAYAGITDNSWLGKSLFMADCQDSFAFEPAQDTNSSFMAGAPYSATKMYFASAPWNCSNKDSNTNSIADIAEELNAGHAVSSWLGHGGFEQFGAPSYLHNTDISSLTANGRPSVMLNANCFTGAFYHSGTPSSLMESLLDSQGGIVSGFAPGTYMFTFQAGSATEPFYREVYGRTKERLLGSLYQLLFLELSPDQRISEGMVAFGDPATKLAIPAAAAPDSFQIELSDCGSVEFSWQPGSGFSGDYHIYRSTDPDAPFTKLNGAPVTATSFTDGSLVPGVTYYYYVAGVDAEGFEGKGSSLISYSAPATGLTLNPPALPDGELSAAYSQTVIPAGGTGPYTFEVLSGNLPSGLLLNATTGEISGVPDSVGSFNFTIKVLDSLNNCGTRPYVVAIVESCLFCDDFEDGIRATDWDYSAESRWSESGGKLIAATPTGKATAYADPAFATGCSSPCTVETVVTNAGGVKNQIRIYGWYQSGKNFLELTLKEEKDQWMLKHKSAGTVVAKTKTNATILPNTPYTIRITFDGTTFNVYVDNSPTPLLSMNKGSGSPHGTVGFYVKNTTGSFNEIKVQD